MKKNKLYTANRWNQPAFMQNRFDWGGLAAADKKANPWNYADDVDTTQQYMNSKNTFGISKANNPFSKGNLAGGIGAMAKTPVGGALIGGLAGTVGQIGGNLISGGLQSGVGNAVGSIGSTVGSAISSVNPVLGGIVSVGSGLIGGAINGLFGTKVDEAKLRAANEGTAAYNNFQSNASSFDDVTGPTAQANVQDAYSGGLFSSGSADEKNEALRQARRDARQLAFRGVDNNIFNLQQDQMNNALANYSAFGGPIETGDMGAIDYGFMTDYLNQKKRKNDMKSKTGGITPIPAFMPNSYAIGGNTDESAASQLARGWYDGTIGGFVNMGKAIGKEIGKLFSSDEGNFGGGSYSGAGRTSRWKPAYNPKNKDNFNKAFDEARKAGAETFMFGDKEYSTTKEANPVREFNNRHVGAGRTEEMIRQRGTYGRDFGPITGRYSLLPVIPYALGGDLQTNGEDFSTGLVHINAGGSHETNPNEGIQIGKDNEGTPNLVEEGETIWNDYVFSARIPIDKTTKEMFHIGKKREMTYADLSKKLEKEITERVNDPISKAGFEKQMQMLEEQQERQKQEMEAERAKAAFEALSPEEQTALMQQRAEQEAMAQQVAMQESAAQQQPTPEELAIAQQQQQMADGSEAALGQEPENLTLLQQNVNALGGELVKAGDVEPNRFDYGGKKGSRKARKIARKYDEQWFKNMAKSLGISDKEMEGFVYSDNDPEANLVAFNNIYRNNQYDKARDTYRKGQRQSKRNELFGDKGLYSYSDDKSKIYKARTNDVDKTGWINKDYTGAVDAEGKMLGFLSQEGYDKLKPEEKEAYKRINERAGDRMYDYNGRIIKDLYNGTEDELLNSFDTDYDKGFKWNDKDAQTLQYPVGMEHSATSAMRYIPAIGGAIGLAHDIFSSPDYSRPQAIIEASRGLATPSQVQPHYIGNYLTYRPLDIWYQQNALNAQSRATDRALMNTSGGNRGTAMAGLLANGYNSQLASGNLFRQAQEYNDALKQKVEDFNRGTNIFNANADMDSQKTNAMLRQQAGRLGLQGLMTGYGMMDDIDARRQASMNTNLTNVLQSLGNIGEEAYDEDRLRWLERTGTLKSRTLSANGGKLKKKKRGLTI